MDKSIVSRVSLFSLTVYRLIIAPIIWCSPLCCVVSLAQVFETIIYDYLRNPTFLNATGKDSLVAYSQH